MANDFPVQNRVQVIVPVRFHRAVSGAPRIDAPDLDDRAWHNPHFTNWTDVGVLGPIFGILQGDTVRVKLRREHLDDSAPVFITVRLPSGASRRWWPGFLPCHSSRFSGSRPFSTNTIPTWRTGTAMSQWQRQVLGLPLTVIC